MVPTKFFIPKNMWHVQKKNFTFTQISGLSGTVYCLKHLVSSSYSNCLNDTGKCYKWLHFLRIIRKSVIIMCMVYRIENDVYGVDLRQVKYNNAIKAYSSN